MISPLSFLPACSTESFQLKQNNKAENGIERKEPTAIIFRQTNLLFVKTAGEVDRYWFQVRI